MTITGRVAPILFLTVLLAGPLAACSSDDGDIAKAETTTTERDRTTTTEADDTDGGDESDSGDETTTTDEPIDAAELGDLNAVPADDGGALCAALEAWDKKVFVETDATPQEAGATYLTAADVLRSEVAPATPEDLRDDLEVFASAMENAGEALKAYTGTEQDPDALMADGTVPELNALLDLVQPRSVVDADGTESFAYTNRFAAWANDPCGPKALAVEE